MSDPIQPPQYTIGTPYRTSVPTGAQDTLVWAYAGFWWRVLAWFIDSLILATVEFLTGWATGLRMLGFSTDDDTSARQISDIAYTTQFSIPGPHVHWVHGGLSVLWLVLGIAYFVLLESSRWQATIGKRICRLRVTDLAGRRISILRALGRYLGKFVSAFILGIGFLMIGWTRRKQGLHDLMADTLVMRLRAMDSVFAFQPPQP